jgi:hypothetical protein
MPSDAAKEHNQAVRKFRARVRFTIHLNYNGWIKNLEKAIKVQASTP